MPKFSIWWWVILFPFLILYAWFRQIVGWFTGKNKP